MRKSLLIFGYILAALSAIFAVFSLFSLLNLKLELLTFFNAYDFKSTNKIDSILVFRWLWLLLFGFSALGSVVCLLIIDTGKLANIKYVYIEKLHSEWVNNEVLESPSDSFTTKKSSIISAINTAFEFETEENLTTQNKMFKAICRATNAVAATCFLFNESNSELELKYYFAFDPKKRGVNTFPLGKGLIGQVALDLHPKVFNTVPGDYLNLETGIGSLVPTQLLLFPFFDVESKQCQMVIELAYFIPIKPELLEALSELNYQIASRNPIPIVA